MLDPFAGEVFVGALDVQRHLFRPGTEFCWPTFVSGSALWRVATGHLPEFADKKKRRGTVFIVQSTTGRYVGAYSRFSYDAEVMFRPGCCFRVTHWYRGDPIALGQANIREHTFGIERDSVEMDNLMQSQKSLIIELDEI